MIKYIFTYTFISLTIFSSAQNISKEQKSVAKSELKALMKNPEKYLALKNESEEKTNVISKQTEDIASLKKENILLETDNRILKEKLSLNNAENKATVKSETTTKTTEKKLSIQYTNRCFQKL